MRRWAGKAAATLGVVLQRLDGALRAWTTAGVLLVLLTLVLAAAMLLER